MRQETWRLAVAAAGAIGGALVKLGGALAYGSRSLLADALTSIASLAALAASIYFYRESSRPPDPDHPYGHERLALAPSLIASMLYSCVVGFMSGLLALGGAYTVDVRAPGAALLGGVLYVASIRAAGGLGDAFRAYATLSASEVLESAVVSIASLAGATLSYLADAAGAVAILAYVSLEVADNVRYAIRIYVDPSAPRSVYKAVAEELEREGLSAAALRIRVKAPGVYQGDVAVSAPPGMTVAEIHSRIRRVQYRLARDHNVDLVVHVVPEEVDGGPSPIV